MLRNRLFLLLSALGLIVASVVGYSIFKMAAKGAHAALIPKDAYLAFCVNLPSLGSKIDLKSLEDMELFDEIKNLTKYSYDRGVLSKAIRNPKKSGIKWHSKLYFFYGSNADDVQINGSIFCIANEKKFEKLLKDLDVDNNIQREPGFNYLHLGGNDCVAWNSGVAVTFSADDQESEYLKQEVEKIVKTNWNKNKERSASFEEFCASDGDFSYWSDFNLAGKTAASNPINKITKDMDIESFSQFSAVSFMDNSIEIKHKYYVLKEGEPLEILKEKGISDAHLSMVSEKDIYGMLALNLNMESCMDLLYSGDEIKESMDAFIKEYGISKKELKSMFTGEFSLSMSGFDAFSDTSTATVKNESYMYSYPNERVLGAYGYEPLYYEYRKPKYPTLVFAASMKNPEVLKNYLEKNGRKPNAEGVYELYNSYSMDVYGVLCNQGFMITNSWVTALELQRLREFKIPKGAYKSVVQKTSYFAYFALNPSYYPAPLKKYMEDEMGFKVYNAMVQFMNEFSHFESHYEDNMQVATIHMNQGSKKNSLMRMLELINGLLEEKALGNM
jgi:hypothetical protein